MNNLKNIWNHLGKGYRYFLMMWIGIFTLAFLIFVALSIMSHNQTYNANLVLSKCHENNNTKMYYCDARLKFDSNIFRSQKNISNLTINDIKYNDINQTQIINFKQNLHRINFTIDRNITNVNLGTIDFSVDFMPSFKTLLQYFLVGIFVCIFIFLFINYLRRSLPPKIASPSSAILYTKDKIFLSIVGLVCVGMFTFTLYLGFPGYHIIGDTYYSIISVKDNTHPVLISYVLEVLYAIFGKHLFYLFIFNIAPFYIGIMFLICGFYLRFRSIWAIALVFPTFIGNIYFQNFIQYHSFALPMFLFCLYSMILFLLLVPNTRYYKSILVSIFVLAFMAILWRHNAIFSVYPIFLILCYMYLRNRNMTKNIFIKKYILFIILSAILCVSVVLGIPKILTIGQSFPANHPFLHQIAGACVPSNDATCFKDEWYYPHKSWKDVKKLYKKYPLNADPFNVFWAYDDERPFKHEKLKGLKSQWIKSILKYPHNFIKHEMRFIKAMWIQEPAWIHNVKSIQTKASHLDHIESVSDFPENERSVSFSPLRYKIYDTLYNNKITLNHVYGVTTSFIILLLSFVLLWFDRYRNELLVFSFACGFAGFFTAFFVAIFSTIPETRYMSSVLPLAILALVGFVAYMLDRLTIYSKIKS